MDERFIIANRTDVGRAREANEDSMVTFDSPNGRVVAVCDGMGGQAAGDVASHLACDIITDILTNNTFDSPAEAITRACVAANQGILHRAASNPELEGMGATCVMVIIKDGLVYYGWIGDSRIYYIADGVITQLSRDQSYVQQLVDSGQISVAEAGHHPLRNEITNALGLPSMTPPQLCQVPLAPASDSVVLLCSDGLSGMVDNETIRSISSDSGLSLQKRADRLVDMANANGGHDNITVQLIQFEKSARNAGMMSGTRKAGMLMWACVAALVIAVGFVVGFFMTGGREESGENTKVSTETRLPDAGAATKKAAPASKAVREVQGTTTVKTAPNKKPAIKPAKDPAKAFGAGSKTNRSENKGGVTGKELVEPKHKQESVDDATLQKSIDEDK